MARHDVLVVGQIPAAPADVWAVVGDFCADWHPFVRTIRAERGRMGATVRAFTVVGDTTLYREQLIFRSNSDQTIAYLCLEGIEGAERYVGRIALTASGNGTKVEWGADVTAPEARALQIAEGTKPIFEAGIAGLAAAVAKAAPQGNCMSAEAADVALEVIELPGTPRLALSLINSKPGPLVLFLHGIGGARGNWTAQLRAVAPFARAGALDFRGYGDSALGPAQSTVDNHCGDILRLMESVGAEKLILVGHSFGAWIATSFAMRHPDRLCGLVLSGGCTGMSEASPAELSTFRLAREAPLDKGLSPADFAPSVVSALAGPNAPGAVRAELLASMSAIPAATYRDALTCFTNPPERFDFARLSMPVLLMTGDHDRLAPPSEIRAVAGRIVKAAPLPDAQFEEIGDAGHLCNLEQPGDYNRHLIGFVERLLS